MSVSSFKSGRSGSSRSEVRPASSPNSSRAIPCSVCRRPDHHPTPLNPELHQASSSGAALIAPLRALGVSIGQSASPRMNVLYSDAGSERSRRSEGGDNHHSRGPAADGPRVSNGGSTRALEQDVASVRIAHWLLVPRRVRARPGLRRIPPLPSRVPVRRVRPTDTPVPPFGMRRARARRRGERRRPMHRPPRRRTRVAVGYGH